MRALYTSASGHSIFNNSSHLRAGAARECSMGSSAAGAIAVARPRARLFATPHNGTKYEFGAGCRPRQGGGAIGGLITLERSRARQTVGTSKSSSTTCYCRACCHGRGLGVTLLFETATYHGVRGGGGAINASMSMIVVSPISCVGRRAVPPIGPPIGLS